ncbi:hypothetical protein BHE74_00023800 [Ensete ventricosum]|nr:hypothetical protein BHE74_00023800 [Ensete ventricosum]
MGEHHGAETTLNLGLGPARRLPVSPVAGNTKNNVDDFDLEGEAPISQWRSRSDSGEEDRFPIPTKGFRPLLSSTFRSRDGISLAVKFLSLRSLKGLSSLSGFESTEKIILAVWDRGTWHPTFDAVKLPALWYVCFWGS